MSNTVQEQKGVCVQVSCAGYLAESRAGCSSWMLTQHCRRPCCSCLSIRCRMLLLGGVVNVAENYI